jgi:hypothetical protein
VFWAAQVKGNDQGFLSRDITVNDMISHHGDIHHIFPRDYLKKQGGMKRGQYNQIANFAYTQSEINIKIGNKAPDVYFRELREQCSGGAVKYGGITEKEHLAENLAANCIPKGVFEMTHEDYNAFLKERRVMMADKIKNYYYGL